MIITRPEPARRPAKTRSVGSTVIFWLLFLIGLALVVWAAYLTGKAWS